jgi:GAF domain-containing protein
MYELKNLETFSKNKLYQKLSNELNALLGEETDFIANAANFSSLLYHSLPGLNWAGFYIHKEDQLVLGPFQGKPACIRIRIGDGVCGKAAAELKTVLVDDVLEFPGHIACDTASRSEIVIPIINEGELIGLLDLDSPEKARFDREDQEGLETLVKIFCERTYCQKPEMRCA